MKKITNILSLLIVIILSLIFAYPSNAYALINQTSFTNINDTQSLKVGDLTFTNISFEDNTYTSTQSFGLTGSVSNNSNNRIDYVATVYYYDSNHNLIAKENNFQSAINRTSQFNNMSNISILNEHSIDEIYYYRLSINILNYTTSSEISNTPSENYSAYDYVIDKYDVNIVVNKNNTFDITETITAYFKAPRHGIYRTIPLKNTIIRTDGTTSHNRTQVTNVNVNNEYTTSRENGNYKLKIGSADQTLTGEQTYIIKYKYNLGKDPMNSYDELYYNIIGSEWDTVIGNITFSITMPDEFDSSKLGFSSGTVGSTDNSQVDYTIDGNTITGSYNGILKNGEALTVRCELPEGYFVDAKLDINIMGYILLFIPLIFLVISILLWYKFGRDDKVVETVEFYPPQEFNSLEVGFLYKGKAERKDVTSLLIYLANKGYIKITELGEKTLFFKAHEFKITKLKEYDGNNINEQIFLNGLFAKKSKVVLLKLGDNKNVEENFNFNANEVTSSDLYDSFYITMNEILHNTNNKENKNKIFEKSASSKSKFIILMILVTYFLITFIPIYECGELSILLFALLFPGIGFTVLFNLVFGETIHTDGKVTFSLIFIKIFGLIWGLGFGGIPWVVLVLPVLRQDAIYLINYGLGVACILGMVICLKSMPKRTPYGNEILGKLEGFKNFLATAEKDKLESMVMQDPTYFYNILPYAYVLGVSDKWIKKFESISQQAPSWYDSPNAFDVAAFGGFVNSTMDYAESILSSSPSSDSAGGDSSGGGSSGGGSGGGGGGSW